MSKSLEKWLDTDVEKALKIPIERLSTEFFFRDPTRPMIIDSEHFYSPADGIILYQKFIKDPKEAIVEIKGINYTLQDVMGDPEYNRPSLVIGIFMSFYDVHINRIPYGGMLTYKRLDAIESTNKPMLALEKDILNAVINPENLEYLKYNERMYNKIYVPGLDYTYYLMQIADEDVNVIAHFTQDQQDCFDQNERFSQIRWGSQVDLILPLEDDMTFELCQKDTWHVEAGVDKLVKIKFNDE
jgi:phosphatidylserine decarboxylase